MKKQFHANKARQRRHLRLRRRLEGSTERPRLNVFRSGQHIYAQVIDDVTGQTLVSASSLEESLRNFKPAQPAQAVRQEKAERAEATVEQAAEAAPTKGKGAKAAPKAQAKGGQQQKGGKGGPTPYGAQTKTVLPQAQKGEARSQVEQLAAIANNRKVALAREVGKLVAQRAKEKGVTQVVFDRGGYAYHGRVAAVAEGAREVGLNF
jgi:ribosomal protein L18